MATLNGILRDTRSQWPGGLSEHQYSVLNVMAHCRSGVLGSIWERCEGCGKSEVLPQSCGNRHCPLCLGTRAAEWSERVCARLPAKSHFHVVFTLPQQAADLMKENFSSMAQLFFDAVNETLKTFMANNMKCKGGYLAVLHTWGSNLSWHPHIHTIVSAGGYRLSDGVWRDFSRDYLFAVRALSKVFRAIFLRRLEQAELDWPRELREVEARHAWRRALAARPWVVYCEPTLKHTRSLVRYLARYTVRTAIGNARIRRFNPNPAEVTFTWRDYREGGRTKEMTLSLREFIARFAAHIAPRGLRRIRYYGFLARPPKPGNDAIFEEPAAQRSCRHCGRSHWTRLRLPANIAPAHDAAADASAKKETCLTHSRTKLRSFSLQARAGPPNESNKTMKLSPNHSRTNASLIPPQLI